MPQFEIETSGPSDEQDRPSGLMGLTHANPRGLGVDPFEPDAADLAGAVMYGDAQLLSVVAAHAQRLHQHRGHLNRIANFTQGLPQREEIDALMADALAMRRQIDALFDVQQEQARTIRDLLQLVNVLRQQRAA